MTFVKGKSKKTFVMRGRIFEVDIEIEYEGACDWNLCSCNKILCVFYFSLSYSPGKKGLLGLLGHGKSQGTVREFLF